MEARRGAWWDANKIGLSPPQGWLVIYHGYHGVKHTAAGCIYRLGLALFDLYSPERCLKRGSEWVFGPVEPYEQHGDVGNVVFPAVTRLVLMAIYGAADTSIGPATGSLRAMLEWLESETGKVFLQKWQGRLSTCPAIFVAPWRRQPRLERH